METLKTIVKRKSTRAFAPELVVGLEIPAGFNPVSEVALGYVAESNPTEKEAGITLAINYAS